MKILAIYYKPDVVDCYTVYFNVKEKNFMGKVFFLCLCMDDKPFSPLGFCQHSSGQLGFHNGHKMEIYQLPVDCQKVIAQELAE